MTQIDKIEIPFEEIRTLVLDYLRGTPSTQYLSICSGVAQIAVDRKIVSNPHGNRIVSGDTFSLISDDQEIVREIIWNLLIQRILTIGISIGNDTWPFLKLTKYGQEVVRNDRPIPHDPSGYLSQVMAIIPEIDEIAYEYLKESIHAYNIGANMAALVMLGCASEKIFTLMIDSYIESFSEDEKKIKNRRKYVGKPIKRQYDEFSKSITSDLGNMEVSLSDGIPTILLGIFEIIRTNRNDVGHPTGKTVTKEQLFAYLQIFITYCRKVYDVINYFNNLIR